MYFHTMNKFKENEQFSVVLSIGQQNDHFQGITCSRLVYFNENFYIFIKWTDFNQFSRESLIPFSVKWPDFQGISCLISKDIPLVKNTNFSSQMLYRSMYLYGKWTKWTDFSEISWSQEITKMNRFSWNLAFSMDCLLDTNQISKEPYRSVSYIEKLWILRNLIIFSDLHEIYAF